MATVYRDRVKETTRTTGLGAYIFDGPVNGFQAFSGIGVNNSTFYCCEDGTTWEVGSGVYTTNQLTRLPIATSNNDALVNWGGGTRFIYGVVPASQIGASGALDSLNTLSDVTVTSPTFPQRLSYNGARWVNSGIFPNDIPSGLFATTLASGTPTGSKVLMGNTSWDFPYGPLVTAIDGATITFDLSKSSEFITTLGGNRTLALTNNTVGQRFITRLVQDGVGTRLVTWFAGANWPGGVAPTLTVTANKADWFEFINVSGTTYDGRTLGLNY